MSTRHLVPVALAVAVLAAACTIAPPSTGGGPSQTDAGSPPPIATPSAIGGIDHPTGPTDVILRMEEGGGFVPIDSLTTRAPLFTLYGDGAVIFRDPSAPLPAPSADGSLRMSPFLTVRLDEPTVQELLEYAIAAGGLGAAREGRYDQPNIADASSTWFDLRAGGNDKRVEIYALGFEGQPGPDAGARASFARLAQRLRDFAREATGARPWDPERYRGILYERTGVVQAPRPWPWSGIAISDFASDPNMGLLYRSMTPADTAALGGEPPLGGLSGIVLGAPEGAKRYLFSARPLFPDEAS